MTIATADMKHGMKVTLSYAEDGDRSAGVWEVLDKSPRNRQWWLHRWNDGVWETTEAAETAMVAADTSELSAPVLFSAKWTKAAYTTADVTTVPATPKRQTGYVMGHWGTRRDELFKEWRITHLPTGLSVGSRPTMPTARALITALSGLELTALDRVPFGDQEAARLATEELQTIKTLMDEVPA